MQINEKTPFFTSKIGNTQYWKTQLVGLKINAAFLEAIWKHPSGFKMYILFNISTSRNLSICSHKYKNIYAQEYLL